MAPQESAAIEVAAKPVAVPRDIDLWPRMLRVPAVISIDVPVVALTVRELFRLEKGSVVASSHSSGANVPLFVGRQLIAWGEFQVVGEQLAVRVADLA